MILFNDRLDAGNLLARKIGESGIDVSNSIILGIPRGGIAVGHPISKKFTCPLLPLTLRKLPLPLYDQMGFGVVNLDKKVILNNEVIRQFHIDPVFFYVYHFFFSQTIFSHLVCDVDSPASNRAFSYP